MSSIKKKLQALEEAHLRLDIRQNENKLGEILSDSFFEIGSSGRIYTRQECLQSGVVLSRMSLHNYEIYPLSDDHFLATYKIIDETREHETLRSSIWRREEGRWRLYYHQGTIVQESLEKKA